MASILENRLFIAGEFVEGNGDMITVINPATKETIASVHVAGASEVDTAVDKAEKAWPAWANGDPSIRAKVLNKVADVVEENVNSIATVLSSEMGKILSDCINDAYYLAHIFRYFAGMADKVHGKTSLNVPGFVGMEIRQPYGVTAGIIPWNSPLSMLAWKTAPAMATGNASIIKTSEKSPLNALVFAKLAKQAGVPDGILTILSGGRETGELLSSHMRIRKIAFTGSPAAGRAVAQAAARSNLKSVTLELGGKSPFIVFDDCDFEDMLPKAVASFTSNSGQVCIAGSRIYVQDTIYDKFIQRLATSVESISFGDPSDPNNVSGPMVDYLQYNRVMEYLEIGKKEGNLLAGGVAGSEKGYYVRPTVFTDVSDDARINREEIFGPVAVVHKFSTEEEVLRRQEYVY
uniref:Aldehyde dehydrogenase domain-containing protein n=1 Tax=Psilocybe cubensis TaxID=181762 RepID=A0A8H7XRG9_PSICU